MTLRIGQELGSYEITSLVGKGGMGEVYRARDTKLKREVAIKILPEEFSRDPERVARFQREAEALASLNHQNIAGIYDLQQTAATRYLIMEFVEGDTLAAILKKRGALPVDKALDVARQICDAIEAAHEKGIVHRDLKPANIKVMPDGRVKVLDFGLAKVVESAPSDASLSNSPTLSMAATGEGIVLGTASYMSPEQAMGRAVDRRTDVFAFGCVLYEMLTGRMAFYGENVADILSRILQRDPDWTLMPAAAPSAIQKLVRICLEKDLKKRRQTSADIRIDIEHAEESETAAAPARGGRLVWVVLAAALILATVLAIPAIRHLGEKAAPEMRVDILTSGTPATGDFALSPDGRSIVYVASTAGVQKLWLRDLDRSEPKAMSGTDGALLPFWSPDGHSIGFFASGKLQRIEVAGGPPQALTDAAQSRGGTWNTEGTIIYSPNPSGPLLKIKASGGDPVAVTHTDPPRQTSHRAPLFLPDGRHFLFFAQGPPEISGIYLGSLDGGEPKRLGAADSSGAWLPPDRIVFVRQSVLLAQHLDLTRGELTGEPVRVADPVAAIIGQSAFSVSRDGRVAYRPSLNTLRKLSWFDNSGKPLGAATETTATLLYPELSRDGLRVAVQTTVQNNVDIWIRELARSGTTRFTFDSSIDNTPLWSPDGTRIAFSSNRKGPNNLYIGNTNRAGTEELLLETPSAKFPRDWSVDGRFLLYTSDESKTGRDLFALPMTGPESSPAKRQPIPIATTQFDELNGQFSSDGRWIAYETNESGRFEIVVQPFPQPTAKWQVSNNGGTQPRWRADGKELYFVASDGKLMAASITASATTLTPGVPTPLFPSRIAAGAGANKQQYAVAPDGRFLINQPADEAISPITLILNWHPEQKK